LYASGSLQFLVRLNPKLTQIQKPKLILKLTPKRKLKLNGDNLCTTHGEWWPTSERQLMTQELQQELTQDVSIQDEQLLMTQEELTQDGLTQDGLIQDGLTQDGLTQDGLTQDGLTQDGLTLGGPTQDAHQPMTLEEPPRVPPTYQGQPLWLPEEPPPPTYQEQLLEEPPPLTHQDKLQMDSGAHGLILEHAVSPVAVDGRDANEPVPPAPAGAQERTTSTLHASCRLAKARQPEC